MEYLLVKPEDMAQARSMVRESVEIYNTRRPYLLFKCKNPPLQEVDLNGAP